MVWQLYSYFSPLPSKPFSSSTWLTGNWLILSFTFFLYLYYRRGSAGHLPGTALHKELTKKPKAKEDPAGSSSIYTALDELLTYLNFNSKAYQKYFTQEMVTQKLQQLINKIKDC